MMKVLTLTEKRLSLLCEERQVLCFQSFGVRVLARQSGPRLGTVPAGYPCGASRPQKTSCTSIAQGVPHLQENATP